MIAGSFLFGLIFGSFLNVCIYRMPRGLSVVKPRSACPVCEKPIAGYDNIPVLSWLLLRGKCRRCKAPISPRYAVVELLTGVFFVLSYLMEGDALAPALKYCTLSFLLIGLVFTDAETQLLPDLLTKPGILLGMVFGWVVPVDQCLNRIGQYSNQFPGCGPAEFLLRGSNLDDRILSVLNSLAGAIFGWAIIMSVALLYKAVRGREGMGMGDSKLMAMIGAFLGIKLTLLVVLLGSIVGSLSGMALMLWVWRKRLARLRTRKSEPANGARTRAWHSATLILSNFKIPFGVFLGTAAGFAAFWGMPLIRWYESFYQ